MGTGRISAELELELELGQEEDMDYKISESEWLLMEQLWRGEMTQAQLAEHLGKKWNKRSYPIKGSSIYLFILLVPLRIRFLVKV